MNRKNPILTMLACLNCVHTTHAVEKSWEKESWEIQTRLQKTWDELEEKRKLHNLRIFVAMDTGNPDWGAVIKKEEIMQEAYACKKNELSTDNPLWSFYDALIGISRDIVKDLSKLPPDATSSKLRPDAASSKLAQPTTNDFSPKFSYDGLDSMFNTKIKAWVDDGKLKLKIDEPPRWYYPYLVALSFADRAWMDWDYKFGKFPALALLKANDGAWGALDIKDNLRSYDCDIKHLAKKYPDIAEQRRNLYKKKWAHDLNSGIKKGEAWIANIGDVILLLGESNTQTGRDMRETILNTLHNNWIGEDQDLAEKAEMLLARAPLLKQIMLADQDNSWDKLEEQCKLHNLHVQMGTLTGNPDRDAAIAREKIMQEAYAYKKNELSTDDPLRSFYEGLIDISREMGEYLNNLPPDESESFLPNNLKARFNNKIRDGILSGRLNNFIKVSLNTSLRLENPYVEALVDVDKTFPYLTSTGNVPSLSSALDPANSQTIKEHLTDYDEDIQSLATKYPEIAHQRRGVYRKVWKYDLNSGIKNQDQWIANIVDGVKELAKSNTEIGRDMVETVAITLSQNRYMCMDQDLEEKTEMLLEKEPVLMGMVKAKDDAALYR